MQNLKDIQNCYDITAENYAGKFYNELSYKHFDRMLLKAFAIENGSQGKMIDLGCGPGQTTIFLSTCGVQDITGTDLSPAMIQWAKKKNPCLKFEVADMTQLQYSNESFSSAIAFYSIVNFDDTMLTNAMKEVHRVLKPGGEFLLAYHVGSGTVHLDNYLAKTVRIDFHFFETKKVVALLRQHGFEIIDSIEREPYQEEHQTKRAYVWIKKRKST
jgi:ubiquinone/menaquinone biosynthesis C-methylase UbiE